MNDVTHFVYPYIIPKDPKFGWELMYSIRSLFKNFKGKFDITIIGEIPNWVDTTKIIAIQYDNSLTYNNKSSRINDKVRVISELYDEFVMIHDEHYLVGEVTLDDIKNKRYLTKYTSKYVTDYKLSDDNKFKNLIIESLRIVQKHGKEHVYNYVLHTPNYYESTKVKEVLHLINMINNEDEEYLMDVIYGNYFTRERIENTTSYKFGVYTDMPIVVYHSSMFFNHDDVGFLFNMEILKYLGYLFPNKSFVEK